MRKIILILIILNAFSTAKAQSYVPFPDSNVVWEVAYYDEIHCPPPTHLCYTLQWYIKGDTTINSTYYHKLYNIGLFQPSTPSYEGAIRQDTLNRKLFWFQPNNPSERLIWDLYNINIGDTLPYTGTVIVKMWVTDIDTVTIGGIARKKYLLDCANNICNGCYIIEGIGSSSGFLEPIGYYEGGKFLICYKQNDTTYYSPYGQCDIINNPYISESNIEKFNVQIFPNPATTQTTISYTQLYTESRLQIFNILGQLLYEEKLQKGTNQTTINTTTFKQGIYKITLGEYSSTLIINNE